MKIIILILSAIIIYANEVVLSKKEKDTPDYIKSQAITLKTFTFSTFNTLMPDFLQADTNSSVRVKYQYEVFNKTAQWQLSAHIKLIELSKTLNKVKFLDQNKTKTHTRNYKFSLKIYGKLKDGIPTITFKPYFQYKNKINLLSFSKEFIFNEYLEYYSIFINEYKEVSEIFLKKVLSKKDLFFKAQKTFKSNTPHNLYYNFGIYKYLHFKKKSSHTIGFVLSGEKEKVPFIYSYKLFYKFRHLLFNKKYFFVNLIIFKFCIVCYNYKDQC